MTAVKLGVAVHIFGIEDQLLTEEGEVLLTETGSILLYVGDTWIDVTSDVIQGSINAKYGIIGYGPKQRVGQTGTLKFNLRNDAGSSGSTLGYYSPDNAGVRSGFELGKGVRFVLTYSGSTIYKWVGTMDSIKPIPGRYKSRQTQCIALDWFNIANKTKTALQAVQFNVSADTGIAALVSAMPNLPTSCTLAAGQDTFPTIFDSSKDEKTAIRTELGKLVMSEQGYLYIKGNAASGGELVFEDRHARAKYGDSIATISGSMLSLDPDRAIKNIFNKIKVEVNPREIDASASVLYTLQSTPKVPASGSLIIEGRYTDPIQRGTLRIGGASMITPASLTDYAMYAASDGSGACLTGNFTVATCYGGNSVRYKISNGGAEGYITLLQARGRGIAIREPSISEQLDNTSITTHGESVLTLSMPYQEDPLVADDTATALLSTWKDPLSIVKKVRFIGNHSDTLMTYGMLIEPGDKVTIAEEVTGIDTEYFVNGIEINIDKNNLVIFTWYLAPPEISAAWLLGIAGDSELGETTFLGR